VAGEDAPARRPRWSLRTRLRLLLLAVGVLLAATLATQVLLQAHQRDVRNDLLGRVDPAVVASTDLRAGIVDQEAGVRGFALTDDPRFLDSYTAGVAATDDALGRLDAMLDGETLDGSVAEVQAAVERWQTRSAEPVIDADTAAERATVRTDEFQQESLQRVDALRGTIDELEAGLLTERTQLVGDLDAAAERSTLAMLLQVAGVLASGALLLLALGRVVVRPIGRLGRDARLVADGDLDHTVRGEGSPDLVQLGADVDAMRTRILEEVDLLNAASADLERQAAELARSNADLEQFAYVASHDLQEPLRKVSSFCQLLQKRYSDQLDERADEYIRYAVDGAKRMQDLINDLLTFSRVGRTTETFTPVDVAAVVADVLEVLGSAVDDAGATVTVGELPVVTGDRRLLGAALQNLIGNALKFRGEAPPRVDITATLTAAPGGRAGDEWVISVADNGIGIEPDYGEQIFVIFKRLHAKTEYAGTGIGLALTKKIIEFHEGRIWLEPTDGPGSTFRFALPARTTTTAPSTATAPPATARTATTPPTTAPPTTEQPAAALPTAERGTTDVG